MHKLAEGAGKILLKYFTRVHRIERKRNAGIVTEADKAAEKFLLKEIFKKFRDSSIITEESGKFEGSEWCWVLDPLDGTTNYAHGFPFFCVSIGLYRGGKPIAGMVYHPISGEFFFAETGLGAQLNGKPIRVSKTAQMRDSLIGTGFYYSKGKQLAEEMEIFERVNEKALGVRRPGAAALDLAYLACGRYDGFWERRLSPWDVAAGFVLITEAGGRITNYSGKPTTIFEGEAVASNGLLHRKLVNLVSG